MKHMIDGFLLAIQFLTTLPLCKNVTWDRNSAKWSVRFYPIIGLLLGVLLVIQAIVLLKYTSFSAGIIGFWLLFFSILFSGGLHLDGWMDASDAIFSYRDRKRKLEIMSDSHVGAFGVISLFFLLGFRFLFIMEILQHELSLSILLIGLIPLFSRTAIAVMLITGKSAKASGMAAAYEQFLSKRDLIYVCLPVFILILTVSIGMSLSVATFSLFIGAIISLFLFKELFKHQIGGITGDTLGALSEGEETILWGILWLLHSFAMA